MSELPFGKKVIVVSAPDADKFQDRANFGAQSSPIETRKYIPKMAPFFFKDDIDMLRWLKTTFVAKHQEEKSGYHKRKMNAKTNSLPKRMKKIQKLQFEYGEMLEIGREVCVL